MLTNVVLSAREVNIHSMIVRRSGSPHSTSILLFRSIAFTLTSVDALYISHSQRIFLPTFNFPLLLVNQNFVVIAGSINALNTSATGLRINISAFAIMSCLPQNNLPCMLIQRKPENAGFVGESDLSTLDFISWKADRYAA